MTKTWVHLNLLSFPFPPPSSVSSSLSVLALRPASFVLPSLTSSLDTASIDDMTLQPATFILLFLHAWTVWAEVDGTMPESVEVYLGDSAEIPCQYNITGSPSQISIQYFVHDQERNSRTRIIYSDGKNISVDDDTEYSGRIQVTSDQQETLLTIQKVQLSDEREFFCSVNALNAGYSDEKTHLRVFAEPDAPVIQGVQTGISVTNEMPSKVATCEVRNGFPKPNITWYRNDMALVPAAGLVNVRTDDSLESSQLYSILSTLEYKVQKEDKDANFSCEVSFFVPGAIRTVESGNVGVSVHYPTTMVELWRESPQRLVKEGDTVELRCHGDGNPPPTFIISREQDPDVDLEAQSSVLVLQAVSRKDSGIYQCRPLDTDTPQQVKGEMQLNVHYLDPAVLVPAESEDLVKGEHLTATCNALSSLKTSTIWHKDGKMVGQGNTLHLQDVTYEMAGEYVCNVTAPSLPSLHTSGSVHIVVNGGPQLVGEEQEVQLEETLGRMVNLTCKARGHPAPSITWSFVGSQSWQVVASKSSDHVTRSVVSVTVASDISAQCNASNDLGADVRDFSIKAVPLTPPRNPFSPEGNGVIIVVIILCLLLLATLGSVLYFLHKKGKIPCGRSGKQDISKEKTAKDDIVVEMKSEAKTEAKSEDVVLLKAVNGDKNGPSQQ
ncbi:cell surface glycoprotein MUC18 isoform X2 [Nerophis ophidion]|uniref:cell surface glycoprotein MUC18 isoform X2 n=1 Tax=Nerophis ophidion TaxID=159077 RepID=UPI002AE0A3BA|nr:cell surface glycoprotein MUC18 isoform X2 [Nerophis ophidion]